MAYDTHRTTLKALTPSSFSVLLCTLITLAIVGGTIGIYSYKGSGLEQEVIQYRGQKAQTQNNNFQDYFAVEKSNVSTNEFLGNIPLMVFWGVVGIAVYFLIISVAAGFSQLSFTTHELDYINVERTKILKEIGLHLSVRVVAGLSLLVLLRWFLAILLPYVLSLSRIAANAIITLNGIVYTVVAASLLWGFAHILTVLLRLVFLRTRIFG
jgi:hypothetical protein